VQGVGFRATTRSIARRYPLTGWVRNESDGSVVAEMQGEQGVIESFRRAVRERMADFIANEQEEIIATRDDESEFVIER
jgi:acylphosphatase